MDQPICGRDGAFCSAHQATKLDRVAAGWSLAAVLTPAGARVRDTAARLMSDRGVASVSMRDLAKELHMQAPSIYSHFPSQGALIEAVCSPYTNGVGRLLDVPRSSLPAFLEDWRRVIQFNLYAARIVHCDPAVRDISSGRLGRIQDLSIALILEKHGVPGLLADSLIAAWRAPWMRPVEGVDDRAVEAIGRHIMQVAEQSKVAA